jgi:hypothetical protein
MPEPMRLPDRRGLRLKRYRQVPGANYGTPKEAWGFSLPAQRGAPKEIALDVLRANAALLGLAGVFTDLEWRKNIPSRGGWHVIFNQTFRGTRIHRAYVTVHMNRRKEVYLVKNRAVPAEQLPAKVPADIGVTRARGLALRAVRRDARGLRAAAPETVWFPVKARLRLAHKFRIRRERPVQEWIVYIDAESGTLLSKYDNVAEATARACVFNPNPVVALGDWRLLLRSDKPVRKIPAPAYERVVLRGVPASGTLNGPRVTTKLTRDRLRRPGLDFECESHARGFEEVMVYYHLDEAIRYVESLGFRGDRAIFRQPLPVNARATREDNSWYLPGTKSLGFGTGWVDDAEDGETILHEFGHALQDAICPDFGQSPQAAAMGEGFGDYFAASFFAAKKRRGGAKRLLHAVMSWDGILFGDSDDDASPPCVLRVDGALTYESFDHSPRADEHDNGEIWSATLWDIWRAVGRRVADTIIVESHFQLDGFTTFARGARAIIDADRNLFGGVHVAKLKRVFRKRGIGPVE